MHIHIVECAATGVLSVVSQLVNAGLRNGIPQTVIYSLRPSVTQDICDYFDAEVNLIYLDMSTIYNKITALRKVRKIIGKNVTVHMHSSFAGAIGRIALLFKESNIVYTPHCISYMRNDIGYLRKKLFRLFEWLLSFKNTKYVACSNSEYQEIVGVVSKISSVHLVENSLDADVMATLVKYIDKAEAYNFQQTQGDAIRVYAVGEIRTQKDPKFYADIIKALNKSYKVEAIWIGDGDPIIKAELEETGIHVTGWVGKQELLRIANDCHVYISTSQWEGMPIALIEALCLPKKMYS